MPEDIQDLRRRLECRRELARHFGEIAQCAARSLSAGGAKNKDQVPDLKTQLSALLSVAAVAMHPREVEVFLRYQAVRNKNAWATYGGPIADQIHNASGLPGVAQASSSDNAQEVQMEAVRVYLGHIKHLYTCLKSDEGARSWEYVRAIAGQE